MIVCICQCGAASNRYSINGFFRCYAGFPIKEAKEGMGLLFTGKVS